MAAKPQPMTYVMPFSAPGHDQGCGAHYLEPCDCASGIVQTIKLAFAADLKRIRTSPETSAATLHGALTNEGGE